MAETPPPPEPLGDRLDNLRAQGVASVGRRFRTAGAHIPASVRNFWPIRMTVDTIQLIRQNRVLSLAAEIGFWGVLSVVPLLQVLVSALSWLDAIVGLEVADDVRRSLNELVITLLGAEGTAATSIDSLFDEEAIGLFSIGVITFTYAASRGFTSLVGALGLISGHRNQRNWLMTRVVGVIVAIVSIVMALALLTLLSIGRAGFGLSNPWDGIVGTAIFPVMFGLVICWAGILLHWAPRERTPLVNDAPGALLTATFWIGGSFLAAKYITATSSASDVLGLLGSGLGLLIWLYVISASILIGGQFNAGIQLDRLKRAGLFDPSVDPPAEAIADLRDEL